MKIKILIITLLLGHIIFAQTLQQDSLSLITLYNSTGGTAWTNNSGWLTASINTWYGVTLQDGRVTALNLSNNNLNGSINELNLTALRYANFSHNNLSSIADTLYLPQLQYLILSNNPLTNASTSFLKWLVSLKHLEMDSCALTAQPPGIDSLNLSYLNLSNNNFSSFWTQSVSLDSLYLDNVGLDSVSLDSATALKLLVLSNNNLTVSLHSVIKNLTILKYLDVSGNQLSDSIYTEFFPSDTALVFLNLVNNNFTGNVNVFFLLHGLEYLLLGQNNFSGQIGPGIAGLTNLKQLRLDFNNLSGPIPGGLWSLTGLDLLWLNNNNLSGQLSNQLGQLTMLTSLDVSYNNLNGTLPTTLNLLPGLTRLNLSHNKFSGSIPQSISQCLQLKNLILSNNRLSGNVPPLLDSLKNLQSLLLDFNYLDSTCSLDSLVNLKTFFANNNYFDFQDLDKFNITYDSLDDYKIFPQREFPLTTNTVGDSIQISVVITDTTAQFIWFNALADNQVIDTAASITVAVGDTAAYYCMVKSSAYPSEVLYSQTYATNLLLKNGIIQSEYQTLVSLYHSLDGDNWLHNNNWLSDTVVNYWYGIKTINRIHIGEIHLDFNNLNGYVPDLNNLHKLSKLSLSYNVIDNLGKIDSTSLLELNLEANQISNLPSLPSSLQNLNVKNNRLTFEDFEPIYGTIAQFIYSPQYKISQDTLLAPLKGQQVQLAVNVGGNSNVYQWFKDGQPITGADQPFFIISNFVSSDTGAYRCDITSKIVPSLTIHSGNFKIIRAFSAAFHITDTSNNPIQDAKVIIYGYPPQTTGADGNATINYVDTGRYNFTINKQGFSTIVNELYINENGLDTSISLVPITVNVEVIDQFGPLMGAMVTLAGFDTLYTGSNGQALFWYVPHDTFSLSVQLPPYSGVKDTVIITNKSVSITYNLSSKDNPALTVFPNPAPGQFTLFSLLPLENTQLRIYDITGKLVFIKQLTILKRVSVSMDVKPGIYFIDIYNDRYHLHKKVIIY